METQDTTIGTAERGEEPSAIKGLIVIALIALAIILRWHLTGLWVHPHSGM